MTRNTSQALLALVLLVAILGSSPGAYAVELPEILKALQPIIGTNGLGFYKGNEIYVDSIIALLLFISVSLKFLGERIGKAGAVGIGLALAIALITSGFSFQKVAPFAIIILFFLMTWVIYSVVATFAESNRLGAFAVAFVIAWTLFRNYMTPEFVNDFQQIFSWLNLLYAVMMIITIYSLVRMAMSLSGGASTGGGGGPGLLSRLFNRGGATPSTQYGATPRDDERAAAGLEEVGARLGAEAAAPVADAPAEAAEATATAAVADAAIAEAERAATNTAMVATASDAPAAEAAVSLDAATEAIEEDVRERREILALAPREQQLRIPARAASLQQKKQNTIAKVEYARRNLATMLERWTDSVQTIPQAPKGLGKDSKRIAGLTRELEDEKLIQLSIETLNETYKDIQSLEQLGESVSALKQSTVDILNEFNQAIGTSHTLGEAVAQRHITAERIAGQLKDHQTQWSEAVDSIKLCNSQREAIKGKISGALKTFDEQKESILNAFDSADIADAETAVNRVNAFKKTVYDIRTEFRTLVTESAEVVKKLRLVREQNNMLWKEATELTLTAAQTLTSARQFVVSVEALKLNHASITILANSQPGPDASGKAFWPRLKNGKIFLPGDVEKALQNADKNIRQAIQDHYSKLKKLSDENRNPMLLKPATDAYTATISLWKTELEKTAQGNAKIMAEGSK